LKIIKNVYYLYNFYGILLIKEKKVEIKIIKAYENVNEYLEEIEKDKENSQELWDKYMIEPFWTEISQWAPFDLGYMKPKPIQNIEILKIQYEILSKLSIENILNEFINISNKLSLNDDSPMIVALYPLCDSNKIAKNRQNGVFGCCVFGNIIININPLANDYINWIPFVFAHEYNHSVWGNEKYGVQGGKNVEGTFLEYMITEGQADAFAESLFPELIPQWNRLKDENSEIMLWKKIKPILFDKDRETHNKFMFGDEKEGLPWCIGYYFGRVIIGDYLSKNKNITFNELINIPSIDILQESRLKI
jgi:uncharacterized protein YjaZ